MVNVYPFQLITDQPQTIHWVKTFTDFSITPSSAPTTDYEVANKKYVDDQISWTVKSTFLRTTVWGSSTEVITWISGVDSVDVSNVTIHTPWGTPVSVEQSYCWTDQITVEFSADPSNDTIVNVAIFWPKNEPTPPPTPLTITITDLDWILNSGSSISTLSTFIGSVTGNLIPSFTFSPSFLSGNTRTLWTFPSLIVSQDLWGDNTLRISGAWDNWATQLSDWLQNYNWIDTTFNINVRYIII